MRPAGPKLSMLSCRVEGRGRGISMQRLLSTQTAAEVVGPLSFVREMAHKWQGLPYDQRVSRSTQLASLGVPHMDLIFRRLQFLLCWRKGC